MISPYSAGNHIFLGLWNYLKFRGYGMGVGERLERGCCGGKSLVRRIQKLIQLLFNISISIMEVSQEQIQANIQRLREKVGDARTGGKGSQRRKVKVVSKAVGGNDKVVKNIVKKVGAHPLGVDEINFFRDDNTILHFKNPEAYASIQNNTFIVSGEPETKTIKDLLPDIIQQLGPKQSKLLESLVSSVPQGGEDVPDLVEDKPASTPQNLDSVE